MKIKNGASNISHWFILVFYIFCSLLLFDIFLLQPMTNGSLQIGADSKTYIEYSKNYSSVRSVFEDINSLFNLSSNFFGPVLILKLVNNNLFLVAVINSFMLVGSYFFILKTYSINKTIFLTLFLTNPMLFVSLTTVNKEIIGILSVSITLYFFKVKTPKYLIITFITSFLTRWHQLVVTILFLLFRSKLNPVHKNDYATITIFVIVITFIAGSQYSAIGEVLASDVLSGSDGYDKSTLALLNEFQKNYMFILILIPKTFINFFGNFNYSNLFNTIYLFFTGNSVFLADIYNEFFVPTHQISMFLVSTVILIRNRFITRTFKNVINKIFLRKYVMDDGTFFTTIYSIFFSLSIFIQSRYFFPIFILLCAQASLTPRKSHN
jgi:hypothetical protein